MADNPTAKPDWAGYLAWLHAEKQRLSNIGVKFRQLWPRDSSDEFDPGGFSHPDSALPLRDPGLNRVGDMPKGGSANER